MTTGRDDQRLPACISTKTGRPMPPKSRLSTRSEKGTMSLSSMSPRIGCGQGMAVLLGVFGRTV